MKDEIVKVCIGFESQDLYNLIKIFIIHNAELIKDVVSNLHPFITNGFTIMDVVLKVNNKDMDKIMVTFG